MWSDMARILVGLKAVPAAAVQNVERSALHAHARVMEQLEVWGRVWGPGVGVRCVVKVAG